MWRLKLDALIEKIVAIKSHGLLISVATSLLNSVLLKLIVGFVVTSDLYTFLVLRDDNSTVSHISQVAPII